MNQHALCVLATLNQDNTPGAAVIGFGQTDKLEIVFGTDDTSRKYQNILANPQVAFVTGWDDGETIQYEGVARELSSADIAVVRENYWRKNPDAEQYHEIPSERYFIVAPKWIRYTNTNIEPWDVKEIKL